MLVSELLQSARAILNDTGSVTYTVSDLLGGVNLGCSAVCIYRPDAAVVVGEVPLQPGAKQNLPDGGQRVIDALASGNQGLTVANLLDQEAAAPNWRNTPPVSAVREVLVEERAPGVFWVNPPSDGTGTVEMIYSISPVSVTAESQELPVSEKYAPAVLEYLLYVMFSRDSERTPNGGRALAHQQSFFNLMGVKTQADRSYAPTPPHEPGQR